MQERIKRYAGAIPRMGNDVYVAPGVVIVGDVEVGDQASIWFNAVLRADLNRIRIGARSNVQDGAVIHVADEFGVEIGESVTVGHGAVLHACRVEDEVLVGMKAVILDGASVGARSIIGANALVTGGMQIPPGSLVLGSPARIVKVLSAAEQGALKEWASRYVVLAAAYSREIPRVLSQGDVPPR
jgi:carbonic anhydrase/acetyltransferase-like protein (isoleucine patch superfamily)